MCTCSVGWFLLAECSPVSVSSTSLASNLLTVPRTLNLRLQLGPHSRTLDPDASWAPLPRRPRTPQTQHVPTKPPSCHQQHLLPLPDLRGCAQPFTLKTVVSSWAFSSLILPSSQSPDAGVHTKCSVTRMGPLFTPCATTLDPLSPGPRVGAAECL